MRSLFSVGERLPVLDSVLDGWVNPGPEGCKHRIPVVSSQGVGVGGGGLLVLNWVLYGYVDRSLAWFRWSRGLV
jgi:hypothetical protein